VPSSRPAPMAVAHRGDPVGYRENTVPAFVAAVGQGAGMVELDCQVTSDDRVVVLHDPTLARLWGLDRAVRTMSAADVAAVGRDGHRVPLLAEVLGAVLVPVMVDVSDPEIMPHAYAEVCRAGARERSVFVGNLEALRWLRAEDGAARIGLTWDDDELPTDALLAELRPELYNPRFDLVDAVAVAAMHGRGIGVSTWTVDDEQAMAGLVALGVDAIVTNRLAQLVALLAARPGEGPGAGRPAGPR
jgi:glycerophosphoryl diester phosphodiesterase